MDTTNKTYVTVMSWGYGDDTHELVTYAGSDHAQATRAANDFQFPNEYNNWGYVQHWQDGKLTKEELVRE